MSNNTLWMNLIFYMALTEQSSKFDWNKNLSVDKLQFEQILNVFIYLLQH